MSKVVTRRERRQQMRRERPQRAHGPAPRRRVGGPWVPIGIVAALALGLLALYQFGVLAPGARPVAIDDPKYAVDGEVIGTQHPDESNSHIPQGQKVQYGTTPPTSGSHWGSPAGPIAWGIKDITFPDEATTHNLEHGGIVVAYKALSDQELAKLKDIVRILMSNGYPKIILEPYAAMSDARIAVSAWRWQIKLATYDDVPIVKFVKAHHSGPDAPEPNAR